MTKLLRQPLLDHPKTYIYTVAPTGAKPVATGQAFKATPIEAESAAAFQTLGATSPHRQTFYG